MGDGLVRLCARIVPPALCVRTFEKVWDREPVYVTSAARDRALRRQPIAACLWGSAVGYFSACRLGVRNEPQRFGVRVMLGFLRHPNLRADESRAEYL
jgi:hypothetical protein